MFEKFKSLLVGDYDNIDVDKWLQLKGEQKYICLSQFLPQEERIWKNIDSLYIYDKRLQINIFRYLCMFEEFLRAIINNVVGEVELQQVEKWKAYFNKDITKIVKNRNGTIYEALELANFNSLIELTVAYSNSCFNENDKNLDTNLKAIKKLRNCICHNRLLSLETLNDCVVDGNTSASLQSNIINFYNYINHKHKKGFQKIINTSADRLTLEDKYVIYIH